MNLMLDYIVNAVWQIPLIAIGAAILTRFGRLGPAGRHQVWAAALVVAAILPLAPALTAPGVTTTSAAAHAAGFSTIPKTHPQSFASSARMTRVSLADSGSANAEPFNPRSPTAAPVSRRPGLGLPPIVVEPSWARAITIVWGLVVAAGLARLAIAWRVAGAIVRRAGPAALAPEVSDALLANARRVGVEAPPVRVSDEIRSPVVVGAHRPAILVPPAFARLPLDEQHAALLHEMAHVARRDFVVNLACEALSSPIGWHPVAWEIKAGLRRSREAACDAIASGALGSRDTYARRLISLAGALRLTDDSETSPAMVALISKGDLEDRLMQLIKIPRAPSKLRLLVATAAAAATLSPALLLHVTPAVAGDVSPTVHRAHICRHAAATNAAARARIAPAARSMPLAVAFAAPAAVTTHPARSGAALGPGHLILAQADGTPPIPPVPPPPTASVSVPAPPAPPALAAPPAASGDLDTRIDSQVREAVRMATEDAERALDSEDVRRAMAEAHVDREVIRRQVAEAMNSAEVRQALAQARAAGSVEVRQALEEAKQETIRALDEAEREAGQAAKTQGEHQDLDSHDGP